MKNITLKESRNWKGPKAICDTCHKLKEVCCSYANNEDGTYEEPVCPSCCPAHSYKQRN